MKNKLLNFSKNLIITLGLVVLIFMLFTTSSYAASGDSLGKIMRDTVSTWYNLIYKVALIIFAIAYVVILIKFLGDRTPDKMSKAKESLATFLIMFALIAWLHYVMIGIISLNQQGVKIAKSLGGKLSGIDGVNDEYDLYETALSKAYEISLVPGFIGLIMYLLLVFYTYKFVFIYAKRYINVMVLILLAPVMFTISGIKKIITGVSDGNMKKWVKEFIFNVGIQTLHAIFYATLIGFTLKLSDDGDNLVGALLVLILFGFIFKIDSIIRALFNFVGGSTKIQTSRSAKKIFSAIDTATSIGSNRFEQGATNISSKIEGFGKNITDYKINKDQFGKEYAVQNIQSKFKKFSIDTLESAKQLPGRAIDGAKQLPKKALNGAKDVGEKAWDSVKDKAGDAWEGAKEKAQDVASTAKDIKDNYREILSGERVKNNLTTDEIVAQQHIIDEARGLEGFRQSVQRTGTTVKRKTRNTLRNIKKVYDKADFVTKRKIREIHNELKNEKDDLANDFVIVKKLPKIIKKINKKQEIVKKSDNLNVDVSNTMMLTFGTKADINEIIPELKEKLGENISVSVYAYQEIGSQIYLSSELGSSRLGLGALAEDKYEEKAEKRLNEVITGKSVPKRKLKKPSYISARRDSKNALKNAEEFLKNNDKVNRVYKFSRFNPDTVRKINRTMLKKSREENRYLVVINRVYEDAEIKGLKAKGTYGTSKTFTYNMSGTRKDSVKSVRELKLRQEAALSTYRELERKAENVEKASEISDTAIEANNTVKVGFKYIDNMTPGQIGLRKMIKNKTAIPTGDGMFLMKKKPTPEQKIKSTGIVREKSVIQFVISDEGKLVKQEVVDGKVQGAILKDVIVETKLEKVVQEVRKNVRIGEVIQEESKNIKTGESTQGIRKSIRSGETAQGIRKSIRTEEAIQGIGKNIRTEEATREVSKEVENVIQGLSESARTGEVVPKVRKNNLTEEEVKPRVTFKERNSQDAKTEKSVVQEQFKTTNRVVQNAYEVVNNQQPVERPVEQPQEKISKERISSLEELVDEVSSQAPRVTQEENIVEKEVYVQHLVTLEGQIVKQVVDAETNEIKTEEYVVLNKGIDKENLIEEMSKAMTKEDLDLPRKATSEEKMKKFENLLDSIETARQEEKAENLLGQVLEASTEEEKVLDEIIAVSSLKANSTKLKYLDEENELGRKIAIGEMVNSGILTTEEAQDEDVVGEALDFLNKRIETLSDEEKDDLLFDKALEMDYIKSVEDTLNIGESTPKEEKKPETVEEKVDNLSDLLKTFAKNRVEEIRTYPAQVISDTIDGVKDTIEAEKNIIAGMKQEKEAESAEKKYEKALEESEKKLAKVRKTSADENIVNKVKGNESENQNEIVKITLNFYGSVEKQGEAVTLSNRYSIKDFYDKAHKLDGADLNKTQARFLKENSSKLSELQLTPFSFAKSPVAAMDDWNIYVVGKDESIGELDEEEEKKKEQSDEIELSIQELIDKYYIDIKRHFIAFIDETRITSFDDIHTEPENAQNLYKRLDLMLTQKGENKHEQKAEKIVNNIHKDIRFKNILREKAEVIIDEENEKMAEELLEQKRKEKANQYEKVSRNEAEEKASRTFAPSEIYEEKRKAKDNLLREVLDEATRETEGPLRELLEIRKQQTKERPKSMRLTFNDISKGNNNNE